MWALGVILYELLVGALPVAASCTCTAPAPAFVVDPAAFVAELRGENPDQLADTTTANFFTLFGKAQRPSA